MEQPHVLKQKSTLELLIIKRGCTLIIIPKFHCECNGIERCWARSKWFARRFCNYSYPALKKTVPRSLGRANIPPCMHRKFARKARDYVRGYSGQPDTFGAIDCQKLVDGIKVKRYASHRAVFGEHEVKAHEGEAVIALCHMAPKHPIGRTQPRWLGCRLRATL